VRKRLGWGVYATNQPAEELTIQKAVLAYRDEYVIERLTPSINYSQKIIISLSNLSKHPFLLPPLKTTF